MFVACGILFGAKHHIQQATNIPYQPLLIKLIFSVLAHTEKQFFSKIVFQCFYIRLFFTSTLNRSYLQQCNITVSLFLSDILRDWQDNMEYSITFAGMQHVNGQLVIPKQGRYFVYSHVYFNSLDDKSYLIHFVHHYPVNTTQDLVIMRSVATKCQDMKSKVFLFSSYQGGVFELKNGDRLAVGVSEGNSKSVSAADTASYFGAFMI